MSRCCVADCRAMSRPAHSSPSVWPLCSRRRSSRTRRVGSASALKARSTVVASGVTPSLCRYSPAYCQPAEAGGELSTAEAGVRTVNAGLAEQQVFWPPAAAALDQGDVVEEPPALPREQELSGPGKCRHAVEYRLGVTPVPLPGRPPVDDVDDLAAGGVDPGQVGPGHDVGPHPPVGPGEIVEAADALPAAAHHDEAERRQGPRIAPDQLAASVAGQHERARVADPPALAVVGDGLQQGQAAQVPPQRDSLLPGQLPEMITYPADALGEQVGRQGRAGVRLAPAQLVTPNRRLAVEAGALPHRPVLGDQALGEAPAGVGQTAQYLEAVEPHPQRPTACVRTRRAAPRPARAR